MNTILIGYKGFMGLEVVQAIKRRDDIHIIAGIDPKADGSEPDPCYKGFDRDDMKADMIIDFSHHSNTADLLRFAEKLNCPLVLATTGQTPEEREMIEKAAKKIPVFFTGNYSLGIAVLTDLVKRAVRFFPDAEIEIIEKHHNRKADAPSGTALNIAEAIRNEKGVGNIVSGRSGYGKREPDDIGISSIRIGNIVGEHEILISTGTQTLSLKHEAHSRALFADGAIEAACFLLKKEPGLYSMPDMIKEKD